MLKEPKIRNKNYRKWISTLPCMVCLIEGKTQAAHIRTGNYAGMGLKSSDDCCVPLCVECHAEQHHFGEKQFWGENLESAQKVAKEIYALWKSGEQETARSIIGAWQ